MKYYLLPILALGLLVGCKDKKSGGPTAGTIKIKGTIAGVDSGYIEYFLPSSEKQKFDSIKIEKGSFSYSLDVKEPELIVLRRAGQQGSELSFFADPGTIEIKLNKDSSWTSEIKGGKTQDDFKAMQTRVNNIMQRAEGLYPAYMQAQQTKNVTEIKRIEGELISLQNQAKDSAILWANANKNSVLSAYIGLVYLGDAASFEQLKGLYDSLSPAVKTTYFGRKISEQVEAKRNTTLGATAPDFAMNDQNGKSVSLSSFKGKYVLLDFWASWCKPCRAENPNVVANYLKFKDKNFTILGISLDREKDAWVKAIADDKLSWTQLSDLAYMQNAAALLYNVESIPANFLIDPSGKIIAKNLQGPQLEAKLSEVLK